MLAGLLTATVSMYWGASKRWCVGLIPDIILQTFGGDIVLPVKIPGAFKTETSSGWKWDLTTWIRKRNGVNLALGFTTWTGDTTEMRSSDKKYLHKTWLTVCLLIGEYSDLHTGLRSNWQTGLPLGAKVLDIGRTVFEKGVAVAIS